MVRAKYRILGIRDAWNQQQAVDAAPIMPRTADWPSEENSEENAAFWSATPSGKLELTFEGGCPFRPDQAVYLDLEPVAERPESGAWRLEEVRLRETQIGVSLHLYGGDRALGCRSGTLTMEIDIAAGWRPFRDAGPGTWWAVTITLAR